VAKADPTYELRPTAEPAEDVEISVIVPVYGCAGCVEELHERVTRALHGISDRYELILVDDRSPDGAWDRLRALALADPSVRSIRLSRNFGQHAAITAGLAESRGRWAVVMDCDLEEQPEDIPRLYAKAQEGFDIVLARRKTRHHSWLRRRAARTYFRLMNVFLKTDIDGEYGTFSLVSRKVVDSYLSIQDKGRHYLFILYWLGYRHASIDIEQAPRKNEKSSYTFTSLVRHAVDGIFFQTTVLLRWIVYLGFLVALLGLGLAVALVLLGILRSPPPGWTSLAVLLLVVGGFIIMSTGVTGLYIGKIFEQVKGRPLYVIDETVERETK
jgi:glycosyltransferase involved in cell wall biosynthesis